MKQTNKNKIIKKQINNLGDLDVLTMSEETGDDLGQSVIGRRQHLPGPKQLHLDPFGSHQATAIDVVGVVVV